MQYYQYNNIIACVDTLLSRASRPSRVIIDRFKKLIRTRRHELNFIPGSE